MTNVRLVLSTTLPGPRAVTVKVLVPAPCGTPVISPLLALIASPAGRLPEA